MDAPSTSIQYKLFTPLLKYFRWNHRMSDMAAFEAFIEKMRKNNEKEYKLPVTLKSGYVEDKINGVPVFRLRGKGNADRVFLYLHGGSYDEQIRKLHWWALDRIALETSAEVVVPIYPLAPAHTFQETYALLEALYKKELEHRGANCITIGGDSAGGGLAAAFCQHLQTLELPRPGKLVLISPWVDTTMTNPEIKTRDTLDIMLGGTVGSAHAKLWAGEKVTSLDEPVSETSLLRDYRISPIFGDASLLPETMMFAGTYEALYPDIMRFNNSLVEAGVKTRLHLGPGLTHDYVLLPVPEGKAALDKIIEFINE